jgi:hypothetical protein
LFTMTPEILTKHILETLEQPNAMRYHKKATNEYVYVRNVIAKILHDEFNFSYVRLGKLLKKTSANIRHNIIFTTNALEVKDPLITKLWNKAVGELLQEKEAYLKAIIHLEHEHDYVEHMNMLVCTICGHAKSIFD